MDQSYILPFVKSVQNVFETMLQLPIEVGEPALKPNASPQYDVSGIIAMSGDVEGSIVLSFPTACAERAVGLFTGMELTSDNPDFPDAIGELVNMVSGGAKAQFTGKNVSISCPTVVIGSNHEVHGGKDLVCICIPCVSDVGEFNVEVALKQVAAEAAA
ncbi:MAG: chemotaxis protein CheX [Planctomycetota bacterium]